MASHGFVKNGLLRELQELIGDAYEIEPTAPSCLTRYSRSGSAKRANSKDWPTSQRLVCDSAGSLGASARRALQLAAAAVVVGAAVPIAGAQSSHADSPGRVTTVVVAGAKYRAGWLHRAILGADYRALWTTPIEVEVLSLRTVAGGLQPTQRGGSAQTGLHHPYPRLVVMPNDTALGELRADFAGVIGTVEERPEVDFDATELSPGATNVISSERLFERVRANDKNVVHTRAFLAGRLFDILVGDRDRHRDQWRWGRFATVPNAVWEPIPRDRDMPFARFEGLGPWIVRGAAPQLVTFGRRYPDMVWLNWNAREIDRRLLAGLERTVWDSVARALQAQITDAVIDSAIAEMPPPFVREDGRRLRDDIIARRQRLDEAAEKFYRVLASEVDFSATDDSDLAEITRSADGAVLIALFAQRGSGGVEGPYLQRRFEPRDTREVRVFLHGGDDRAVVRGAARRDIIVRIVDGDGDDVILDSIPGGDRALRVYDTAGDDRLESAAQLTIERRPYVPPSTDLVQHSVRDWGQWNYTQRAASYAPSVGVLASISHMRTRYGFRRDPFASHAIVRLDLSLSERRPRLTYTGTFRPMSSRNLLDVQLMASGIELIRFHGLGNETLSGQPKSYYRVFQNLVRLEPSWVLPMGSHSTLSLGALAQYTVTRDSARTLIGETQPYGSGEFGEVGTRLGLVIDRRDSPNSRTKGVRIALGGTVYPPVWDVGQTFGEAHITASTYLSPKAPLAPTLALRAGAQRVWGTFPFHDAAFLGGSSTLRGWDEQRFAGRSSLFGSSELRLRLGKLSFLVPADVGILGFSDVGRVFSDHESSDVWHTGVGGGIWIAPITRVHTVSVSVARSRERTGLYLKSGFAF